MSLSTERLARVVVCVLGVIDAGAGLVLLLAPAELLEWFGLTLAAGGAYLRWLGAFVLGMGASYLWAAGRGGGWRLRAVLELTIPLRVAAGGYAAVAVTAGALERVWSAVPVVDLLIVLGQVGLLCKGVGRDA